MALANISKLTPELLMPATANRADLLGPEWTSLYLILLAVGLLLLWIISHVAKRLLPDKRIAQIAAFIPRAALASATLWAGFQLLARGLYLATPWSLWLTAAISGIATERITLKAG